MAEQSPFEVLGIKPTNNLGEVNKAYKKKALEVHPDKHPEAEREQQAKAFQELRAAYDKINEQSQLDELYKLYTKKRHYQQDKRDQLRQDATDAYRAAQKPVSQPTQFIPKKELADPFYKFYMENFSDKFDDPQSGFREPYLNEKGKLAFSFPDEVTMVKAHQKFCKEHTEKTGIKTSIEMQDENGKLKYRVNPKGQVTFADGWKPRTQEEITNDEINRHFGSQKSGPEVDNADDMPTLS